MRIPIPSVCKTNLSLFSRDSPATALGGGVGIEPSHRRIKAEEDPTFPSTREQSLDQCGRHPGFSMYVYFCSTDFQSLVPAALRLRNGLEAWARSARQLQTSAVIRADCLLREPLLQAASRA